MTSGGSPTGYGLSESHASTVDSVVKALLDIVSGKFPNEISLDKSLKSSNQDVSRAIDDSVPNVFSSKANNHRVHVVGQSGSGKTILAGKVKQALSAATLASTLGFSYKIAATPDSDNKSVTVNKSNFVSVVVLKLQNCQIEAAVVQQLALGLLGSSSSTDACACSSFFTASLQQSFSIVRKVYSQQKETVFILDDFDAVPSHLQQVILQGLLEIPRVAILTISSTASVDLAAHVAQHPADQPVKTFFLPLLTEPEARVLFKQTLDEFSICMPGRVAGQEDFARPSQGSPVPSEKQEQLAVQLAEGNPTSLRLLGSLVRACPPRFTRAAALWRCSSVADPVRLQASAAIQVFRNTLLSCPAAAAVMGVLAGLPIQTVPVQAVSDLMASAISILADPNAFVSNRNFGSRSRGASGKGVTESDPQSFGSAAQNILLDMYAQGWLVRGAVFDSLNNSSLTFQDVTLPRFTLLAIQNVVGSGLIIESGNLVNSEAAPVGVIPNGKAAGEAGEEDGANQGDANGESSTTAVSSATSRENATQQQNNGRSTLGKVSASDVLDDLQDMASAAVEKESVLCAVVTTRLRQSLWHALLLSITDRLYMATSFYLSKDQEAEGSRVLAATAGSLLDILVCWEKLMPTQTVNETRGSIVRDAAISALATAVADCWNSLSASTQSQTNSRLLSLLQKLAKSHCPAEISARLTCCACAEDARQLAIEGNTGALAWILRQANNAISCTDGTGAAGEGIDGRTAQGGESPSTGPRRPTWGKRASLANYFGAPAAEKALEIENPPVPEYGRPSDDNSNNTAPCTPPSLSPSTIGASVTAVPSTPAGRQESLLPGQLLPYHLPTQSAAAVLASSSRAVTVLEEHCGKQHAVTAQAALLHMEVVLCLCADSRGLSEAASNCARVLVVLETAIAERNNRHVPSVLSMSSRGTFPSLDRSITSIREQKREWEMDLCMEAAYRKGQMLMSELLIKLGCHSSAAWVLSSAGAASSRLLGRHKSTGRIHSLHAGALREGGYFREAAEIYLALVREHANFDGLYATQQVYEETLLERALVLHNLCLCYVQLRATKKAEAALRALKQLGGSVGTNKAAGTWVKLLSYHCSANITALNGEGLKTAMHLMQILQASFLEQLDLSKLAFLRLAPTFSRPLSENLLAVVADLIDDTAATLIALHEWAPAVAWTRCAVDVRLSVSGRSSIRTSCALYLDSLLRLQLGRVNEAHVLASDALYILDQAAVLRNAAQMIRTGGAAEADANHQLSWLYMDGSGEPGSSNSPGSPTPSHPGYGGGNAVLNNLFAVTANGNEGGDEYDECKTGGDASTPARRMCHALQGLLARVNRELGQHTDALDLVLQATQGNSWSDDENDTGGAGDHGSSREASGLLFTPPVSSSVRPGRPSSDVRNTNVVKSATAKPVSCGASVSAAQADSSSSLDFIFSGHSYPNQLLQCPLPIGGCSVLLLTEASPAVDNLLLTAAWIYLQMSAPEKAIETIKPIVAWASQLGAALTGSESPDYVRSIVSAASISGNGRAYASVPTAAAAALTLQGLCLIAMQDPNQAAGYLQQALCVAEKLCGMTSPAAACCLDSLALFYLDCQRQPSKALQLLIRSLDIRDACLAAKLQKPKDNQGSDALSAAAGSAKARQLGASALASSQQKVAAELACHMNQSLDRLQQDLGFTLLLNAKANLELCRSDTAVADCRRAVFLLDDIDAGVLRISCQVREADVTGPSSVASTSSMAVGLPRAEAMLLHACCLHELGQHEPGATMFVQAMDILAGHLGASNARVALEKLRFSYMLLQPPPPLRPGELPYKLQIVSNEAPRSISARGAPTEPVASAAANSHFAGAAGIRAGSLSDRDAAPPGAVSASSFRAEVEEAVSVSKHSYQLALSATTLLRSNLNRVHGSMHLVQALLQLAATSVAIGDFKQARAAAAEASSLADSLIQSALLGSAAANPNQPTPLPLTAGSSSNLKEEWDASDWVWELDQSNPSTPVSPPSSKPFVSVANTVAETLNGSHCDPGVVVPPPGDGVDAFLWSSSADTRSGGNVDQALVQWLRGLKARALCEAAAVEEACDLMQDAEKLYREGLQQYKLVQSAKKDQPRVAMAAAEAMWGLARSITGTGALFSRQNQRPSYISGELRNLLLGSAAPMAVLAARRQANRRRGKPSLSSDSLSRMATSSTGVSVARDGTAADAPGQALIVLKGALKLASTSARTAWQQLGVGQMRLCLSAVLVQLAGYDPEVGYLNEASAAGPATSAAVGTGKEHSTRAAAWFREAEFAALQSLQLMEQRAGPRHPYTADALVALAAAIDGQAAVGIEASGAPDGAKAAASLAAKIERVRQLCERALFVRQTVFGMSSSSAVDTQVLLARLIGYGQRAVLQADPLYRSAIAMRSESLGAGHPLVLQTAEQYAVMLIRNKKFSTANTMLTKVIGKATLELVQQPQPAVQDGANGSSSPADIAQSAAKRSLAMAQLKTLSSLLQEVQEAEVLHSCSSRRSSSAGDFESASRASAEPFPGVDANVQKHTRSSGGGAAGPTSHAVAGAAGGTSEEARTPVGGPGPQRLPSKRSSGGGNFTSLEATAPADASTRATVADRGEVYSSGIGSGIGSRRVESQGGAGVPPSAPSGTKKRPSFFKKLFS